MASYGISRSEEDPEELQGDPSEGSVRQQPEIPHMDHREPAGMHPADLYKHMAEIMRSVAQSAPAPKKPILERLSKLKTVEFYGRKEEDASVAEDWLMRIKRILDQLQATPEEGMTVAISLLQSDAYLWWESVEDRIRPEDRNWEHFCQLFREKYVGRVYVEDMRKAFMNLKQGAMAVTEYEREFLKYGRYAPELLENEYAKCRRFEDGLNGYLKFQISGLQIDSFPRLVSSALKFERARKESNENRERFQGKRTMPSGSFPSSTGKKFKSSFQQQSSGFKQGQGNQDKNSSAAYSTASTPKGVRSSVPRCNTCGRYHPGECWNLSRTCYKCGKTGHIQRECPEKPPEASRASEKSVPSNSRGKNFMGSKNVRPESSSKQESRVSARTYAIRAREEADDPDVIVGTFMLFNTPIHALIDPGSTHSYICSSIIHDHGLRVERTENEVLVTNPLGHSIIVNKVCRNCPLRVEGCEFSGDLLELSFHEFDAILGMDWLSRHKARVDCHLKRIILQGNSREKIIIKEEWIGILSNIISVLEMQRIIRKEDEVYLAHVKDVEKPTPSFYDTPTVRDFPDVFPEELPGLPPAREVEFSIEVISRTSPISIAPYREVLKSSFKSPTGLG